MPAPTENTSFQSQFHRRWNHLNDPHVRTLAWLLDAPDLLDPHAPEWQGRVATLGTIEQDTVEWLHALEREPAGLHAWLALQPFTRLGRYAEKLMAFYLEHQGRLYAHGVQVRAGRNDTVGEFDFLLRDGEALLHWEFATKLYLLESSGHGRQADYFVGPNLADTLGAKIRKIMERQLALSQHPAAQAHLPLPVTAAQALVKGWLFYQGKTPVLHPPGISRAHCHGFWCILDELDTSAAEHFVILPRLGWLAPAKLREQEVLCRTELDARLLLHFQQNPAPALVALLKPQGEQGNVLLESDRGFIVPDDWHDRAEARVLADAGAEESK